jgi:hypothetical protein
MIRNYIKTHRKRVLVVVAALAVVIPLVVFGVGMARDREVSSTVMDYNKNLVQAYWKLDMEVMEPLVSERQLKIIIGVIHSLEYKGNIMGLEIGDFEILGVERTDDRALVRAREKWDYWLQKRDSGDMVNQRTTVRYESNEYHLVRGEDGWLVDEVRTDR